MSSIIASLAFSGTVVREHIRRQSPWAIGLLTVFIILISAPVYYHRIMYPLDGDFGSHIATAIKMVKQQSIAGYRVAHPLFEISIIGLYWLSRAKISLYLAAVIVQVAAQLMTALILYFWFGSLPGRLGEWKRVFWSVTLTLVAPVMALVFLDKSYYYGYIGLANYHNPTVHLLRPFSLLSFIFAIRVLTGSRSPTWMVVVSAFVMVFSALIKPNYALIILPALGVLVLVRLLRKEPVDWWMAVAGIALPACAVLVAQAVLAYGSGDGNGIIFAPLAVEGAFSSYLPLKLFLSSIFPISTFLAYRKRVTIEPALPLAWFAFGFGLLQVYLLAESGGRFMDANFRWGAQIGLFLLFAASARFLLQKAPSLDKTFPKRIWLTYSTYLPHLAAGIIYYIHVSTSKGYG